MVSPSRRRDAVAYLLRRHPVSERRACKVVGQHRSTNRYKAVAGDYELRLVERMNDLAAKHPRYGYRRIWALLRGVGFEVNHKRIQRLWRLEGHRVPARKSKNSGGKAKGGPLNAAWNLAAIRPHDVWSYDFVSTTPADGLPLRILNVVDEYTRLALGSKVARWIGARDVAAFLEELFERHGRPAKLRSDNGREFVADSLAEFLAGRQIEQLFIEKASPQQNAFVERFNGTMRDEVLNGEHFHSVLEAKSSSAPGSSNTTRGARTAASG